MFQHQVHVAAEDRPGVGCDKPVQEEPTYRVDSKRCWEVAWSPWALDAVGLFAACEVSDGWPYGPTQRKNQKHNSSD